MRRGTYAGPPFWEEEFVKGREERLHRQSRRRGFELAAARAVEVAKWPERAIRMESKIAKSLWKADHLGQDLSRPLTDNNVPVEYVIYPGEPHGFTEPAHQKDLMDAESAV